MGGAPQTTGVEELVLVHSSGGQISLDMPEWYYEIYGKSGADNYFEEMKLVIEDKNGTIVYDGPLLETNGDLYRARAVLADVNFDGYNDVLYTEGPIGTREYYWYHLLLWDNKAKTFVPSKSFIDICNPIIDVKEKVIRSRGSNSAFEIEYNIYRYQNGEFHKDKKLLHISDEVNGKKSRTYKHYTYEDGVEKPGTVFESLMPPDPNHPDEEEYWGPDSTWKLDDPIWDAVIK
jgi:hypothetical protein